MNISKSSITRTSMSSTTTGNNSGEIVLEVCDQDYFQQIPKTGYTYFHEYILSPTGVKMDPGMPNMAREPLRTTATTIGLGGVEYVDESSRSTRDCSCKSCSAMSSSLRSTSGSTSCEACRRAFTSTPASTDQSCEGSSARLRRCSACCYSSCGEGSTSSLLRRLRISCSAGAACHYASSSTVAVVRSLCTSMSSYAYASRCAVSSSTSSTDLLASTSSTDLLASTSSTEAANSTTCDTTLTSASLASSSSALSTLSFTKRMSRRFSTHTSSFINKNFSYTKELIHTRKLIIFFLFILPLLLAAGIHFFLAYESTTETITLRDTRGRGGETRPIFSLEPEPASELPGLNPVSLPVAKRCCSRADIYSFMAATPVHRRFNGFSRSLHSLEKQAQHLRKTLTDLQARQRISLMNIEEFAKEMKNNNLISEEKMNTMTKKLFSITSLSTNSPKPYPVIDMSKYALKEEIRRMIVSALEVYAADKIAMVDYALESMGASILTTRCTRTYNYKTASLAMFGYNLWYTGNSARDAIHSQTNIGNCWPFVGSSGHLAVLLTIPIRVTAVTIDHVPAALTLDGHIDSAPKDFKILGLQSEFDESPVTLGEFQYVHDSTPIQTFYIEQENIGLYRIIELNILSNHGNKKYTCLYRFRVHGKPVK